jgi:hypothetical protein
MPAVPGSLIDALECVCYSVDSRVEKSIAFGAQIS